MRRWIGFLGSWAVLVLALGLAGLAVADEVINMRDLRRIDRVAMVDEMISERTGNKAAQLERVTEHHEQQVNALESQLASVRQQTNALPDTGQAIVVSTEENKLYVRRNGQTIFEAICSTGKGTTLSVDGKTKVFDTPLGKFHVVAKEENPLWVPPDWHYVEEARKNNMRVVHLNPGDEIDADTGQSAATSHGFFSTLFGRGGSRRILKLRNNSVVMVTNGVEQELPAGTMITAGDAIIVPPVDSPQRHFDKVLGKFRLELGAGYGIHGTDEPDKLGQSVSHGCVRLGDDDIARLYAMSNVGDTVIIY